MSRLDMIKIWVSKGIMCIAQIVLERGEMLLLLSKSISKQFEFLALSLELCKNHYIRVVGCYRPPSAISETISTLMNLLSQVICNETVIVGDLNWDWLRPASDSFK